MILRRITKHVTDQNWFAVFIDFLIVVVGILIAFQITEWNEARVNSELEEKYISRLLNDFNDIEERLAANVQVFDESLEANKILRLLITEKTVPKADKDEDLKEILRKMLSSRIPAWESSTFLEMQSAGNINLLSSQKLRTALREYSQMTEIAHVGWQVLTNERSSINGYFDRYVTYVENEQSTDGTSSYRVETYDIVGIFKSDQYLQNMNTILRIQINNRQLQVLQKEKAEAVIDALHSMGSL